jgi:hypothetical protein
MTDLAYIRAVIGARCPELSAADIAAAFSAAPVPSMDLNPDIANVVIEVLDGLEQRLEQIEAARA